MITVYGHYEPFCQPIYYLTRYKSNVDWGLITMFLEKCNEGFVLKVTQDQHKALAEFYRAVEQRAFRMAEIETRNASDAIDLVQDAMEALMKRYLRQPPEQWRPLFYRILQNKIRDWQRRSMVRNRFHQLRGKEEDESNMLENQVVSPLADPVQQYTQDLSMERLQNSLNRLSPRQRQTFLLRIWEGFDVAETARIMGCSQGSVKTHLSRAMALLREILQQHL